MSSPATMSSASTRPRACGKSTLSGPSTETRERILSRASSTGITRLFYPIRSAEVGRRRAGAAAPGSAGQVQDGPVAREEPAAAQHEQGEKARGDQDVGEPVGDLVLGGDRREHQQDPFEED